MALIKHEIIYRANIASLGPFAASFECSALADGNIIAVYFDAEGVSGFSGDWFFGLQVAGTDVLLTTDRPQITSGDTHVEKTGLSIPVNFRDALTPTVDEKGLGSITGPVKVIIVVDDGGGELSDTIHAATSKATPVDADEAGFWDSVSGLLRKATFLQIWTNYFKPKADVLYATPADVNAAINGNSWKKAVRAATAVAGTLASSFENGDAIDGVTLATGDRILIKDQAAPAENGIYVVAASGAPARAADADSGAELVNASVYVSEGTTNADKQFVCTTNAPITINVTGLTFTVFSSGGGGALDDLTDVAITSILEGQVIVKGSGSDYVNSDLIGDGTAGREGFWNDRTSHRSWLGDINANGNDTHLFADDVDELIHSSKLIQYETLLTPSDDKDLVHKKYIDDALTGAGVGTVWRDGSGVPSNALGINGDYYLDTDTGDIYKKAAGAYSSVGNLTGPIGPDGPQGDDGDAGPQGDPGDNGINGIGVVAGGTTGQYLRKASGTDYDMDWAGPPSLTGTGCRITKSGNQSTTTSVWATLTWDTEVNDDANYHSTVTNTSRLTIPANGWYIIAGSIRFAANNTGTRFVRLTKNGSASVHIAGCTSPAVQTFQTVLSISTIVKAVAGDYFEVEVFQNSGGSLNVETGSVSETQMAIGPLG